MARFFAGSPSVVLSLRIVRARAKDFDSARTLLDQAKTNLQGFRPTMQGTLLCHRALVELMAGDRAACESALTEAEAIATSSGLGPGSELVRMVSEVRTEMATMIP